MALNDQDINETMAKDWSAIREKFAVEEPEPQVAEPETETPARSEPETPEPVRARDDAGKFVKQDKVESETPSAEASPAAPTAGGEPAAPASSSASLAPDRDITRAPSTWSPAQRAEFDKLSPAVKAVIHKREQDYIEGHKQLRPDADFGRSMREVVAPYKALIDAEAGGRPEVAFAELMKTAAILRMGTPQQKRDVVLRVAQQYGVDLGLQQPQPAQPGQQPQSFQDPRVDQILQHLTSQQQQTAQRERETLEASVTTWMNQVDMKGAPVHPYIGDVMNEMNALVPQIRQANPSLAHNEVLQRAYDTATWGNPEIRALLQQAQGNGQVREADNQNRVREAKRAASVNVPRRASTPSPGKPGTIDETITETARELGLIS
jgi:hypothetical protein